MEIKIVENYEMMSFIAAQKVVAVITEKRNPVLGLATGSTPEGMYSHLVQLYKAEKLDFKAVTTFNLDEYSGLDSAHPQSYHYYMHQHFFDHINIDPVKINIPSCKQPDVSRFCREYDDKIRSVGGLDLQILGIGVNGHIGFNEPARCLSVYTHQVNLAPETIAANSRFFSSVDQVPRQALTMGMGSIMHAADIVLLAGGSHKAEAIRETVSGKISPQWPSSLLQLHPGVTLIIDQEAAALL